jgi:hypothetical protein
VFGSLCAFEKCLFQCGEKCVLSTFPLWNPLFSLLCGGLNHVRWVPCHHGMARPQVADGEDALQLWREAANILNKQSRAADKGWSSSWGVGRGANNSSP